MRVDLKRGLDVQLGEAPEQIVKGHFDTERTALVLNDYQDLHPTLTVTVGDRVALGQRLFINRKHPEVAYTSFSAGIVRDIQRGAKRRINYVVIERDGEKAVSFPQHSISEAGRLTGAVVRDILLSSGAWVALRSRPFDRVATPEIEPRAIFVTAIDTNPLAPDPAAVLAGRPEEFAVGLKAIATLTSGTTYVCMAPGAEIEVPDDTGLRSIAFGGPHPAGLPGTHIHSVGLPVHIQPDLWHIGYQDVVAIGTLLLTGRVAPERIISIAGPATKHPGLVRTCLGAAVEALSGKVEVPRSRAISGSPLCGTGSAVFLGRYHNQLTFVPEPPSKTNRQRSWSMRCGDLLRGMRGDVSTDTALNGWPSGMLPLENFERVWPFRNSPAALLRALLAGDTDSAARLGCLGLVEEDLALCGYVCPAKREYAAALRRALQTIEKFG